MAETDGDSYAKTNPIAKASPHPTSSTDTLTPE
jgi:hypothetical protein